MAVKLKQREVSAVREQLWKEQKGICPISQRRMPQASQCVLDHCHTTGIVRSALSRAINGVEGKVKNILVRWGQCQDELEMIRMLRGLADYYERHMTPRTDWIYPTHKTPAEKLAARNAKARAARAARKKEAKP